MTHRPYFPVGRCVAQDTQWWVSPKRKETGAMLPLITITDASTAYTIADALRQQADANRRVADRLTRPEFDGLGSAAQRSIEKLLAHAKRLDGLAMICESQGILTEHGEEPTIEFPADATVRLAALPLL